MSESVSKSPQYTPAAALASERILGSVLGRVAGSYSAPIGRTLQLADRVVSSVVSDSRSERGPRLLPSQRLFPPSLFGPQPAESGAEALPSRSGSPAAAPSRVLLTAPPVRRPPSDLRVAREPRLSLPMSAPERMGRGVEKTVHPDGNGVESGAPSSLPIVTSTWAPSEVVRSAQRVNEAPSNGGPLWGALPPSALAPVVAAVEAELGPEGLRQREQARRAAEERPSMTLLQGGAAEAGRSSFVAPQSSDTEARSQRAAMDASMKLLEAVRAHAAAHAASSDDRVSLGDMQLIAFADKEKKLAAASATNAPTNKRIEKALGERRNPKDWDDQKVLKNKIKDIAKICLEEDEDAESRADERYGGA